MSKKRANKSKRRRDPRSGSPSTPPPRLKLVPPAGREQEHPSGVRVMRDAQEMVRAQAAEMDALCGADADAAEAEAEAERSRISLAPDSVEDIEEEARFFHEGHVQTPHAFAVSEDHDDLLAEVRKPSPKMTPAARARRARFAKYVKGAMVGATAILALAGIRFAMGHADRVPQSYVAAVASPPAAMQTAAVEAPTPLSPSPAPPATVATTGAQLPVNAPPDEPKAEPAPAPAKVEAVAVAAALPVAAPTDAVAAAPTPATTPATTKAAAQEKADARALLERGKAGAAIEAGERSVALDPTDGEAWLILGAAYQEKGNVKDARRAFQACSKQGKRGPLAECRAMLQ